MFILVYLCYDYHNYFFQVAAVAAFTQVEEVERILMVPWEWGEKVERDFSRKGWVGNIVGGFGGGGGAYGKKRAGGGGGGGLGGGYSGGSSGENGPDSCGGGGESFNAGKNQENGCCYKTSSHGQVTITLL